MRIWMKPKGQAVVSGDYENSMLFERLLCAIKRAMGINEKNEPCEPLDDWNIGPENRARLG